MTAPDWLTQRGGALRRNLHQDSCTVSVGGHPLYRLNVTPAGGKWSCAVHQTVNGKRVDSGKGYPTVREALQGGLEELRVQLGW